jgi:hypothetical protein
VTLVNWPWMLKFSSTLSGMGIISAPYIGDGAVGGVFSSANPGDAEADKPSMYTTVNPPRKSLVGGATPDRERVDDLPPVYCSRHKGRFAQSVTLLYSTADVPGGPAASRTLAAARRHKRAAIGNGVHDARGVRLDRWKYASFSAPRTADQRHQTLVALDARSVCMPGAKSAPVSAPELCSRGG